MARSAAGARRKRGYGQYCGIARALDLIGDRWTLLIVRELLIRGRARYTDLLAGLPGVATNLLVARLRELEAAGIVVKEAAPPPVATTLFALTDRGEALRPVVHAIGAWGWSLLKDAPPGDAVRSHWIAMPLEVALVDRAPGRPPIAIELRAGEQPLTLYTADGRVRVRIGAAERPDAVVTGPPREMLGLMLGKTTPAEAKRHGVVVEGSMDALRRVAITSSTRRKSR
jgi:DNA-binding HxlR family transcriptional regulator